MMFIILVEWLFSGILANVRVRRIEMGGFGHFDRTQAIIHKSGV